MREEWSNSQYACGFLLVSLQAASYLLLCLAAALYSPSRPLIARSNSLNSSSIIMGDRYGGGGGDGSYGGGGYGECCLPVPSCSQRIPSAARACRRARSDAQPPA